ncbi:hypothetical protein HDU97_004882 [Phlyctochytrium planicorne]|nr:hypothetical protein HDU97_004882 [Phlyctochytrium planicorne]
MIVPTMLAKKSSLAVLLLAAIAQVQAIRISYFDADAPGLCWAGESSSMETCNIGAANQDYSLKKVDYRVNIISKSGKCLDTGSNQVAFGGCTNSETQLFHLNPTEEKDVFLIEAYSGCITQSDKGLALSPCFNLRQQLFRFPVNNDLPPSRPAPIAMVSLKASSGNCMANGGLNNLIKSATCSAVSFTDIDATQTFNVVPYTPFHGLFLQSTDNNLCVGLKGLDRGPDGKYDMEPCQGFSSQLFESSFNVSAPTSFSNLYTNRLCLAETNNVLGHTQCGAAGTSFNLVDRKLPPPDSDEANLVPAKSFRIMNSLNYCLTVEVNRRDELYSTFQPCNRGDPTQYFTSDFGRIVTSATPSRGTGGVMCLEILNGGRDYVNFGVFTSCSSEAPQVLTLRSAFDDNKRATFVWGHSSKCLAAVHTSGQYYIAQVPCDDTGNADFDMSIKITKPELIQTRPKLSCKSVTARKEWRDMSTAEKKVFIATLQTLKTSVPSRGGRRSFYDDLVAIHSAARGYMHGGAMFLPWHRIFLQIYEDALQSINSNVVIPYWAWARDGPSVLKAPSISQIFSGDDLSFGTHRFADVTGTPCVTDGFAKNWTALDGRCLARNYTDSGFVTPDQITAQAIVVQSENFDKITGQLEGMHNGVHMAVGGDGSSDMWQVNRSPNDPVFFLHHANVDRYWYLWQLEHKDIATQFYGNMNAPDPNSRDKLMSVAIGPETFLPGFNIKIKEAFNLGSNGLCSVYASFSQDSKVSRRDSDEPKPVYVIPANASVLDVADPNVPVGLPEAGAGSTKVFFPPREDNKVFGSGDHGTEPLIPVPELPEEFIVSMHPKKLFGIGEPTRKEIRAQVDAVRQKEKVTRDVQEQVKVGLDKFLSENPGDVQGAIDKTVESVTVKAPEQV